MSTLELRKKVKRKIDQLPAEQLRSAAEFIDSLNGVSAEDKRKIANMRKWVRQADRDIATGKTVNWRKVRRDV